MLGIIIFLILLIVTFFQIACFISPLVLNVSLMVCLLIGIFVDSRFNWIRKLFFLLFSMLQVFVYFYCDKIPILFFQDLFWYSVIVHLSFIWHVLILNWLFFLADYFNLTFLKFLFSRLSIITSLTIVKWFFRFFYHVVDNVILYFTLCSVSKLSASSLIDLMAKYKFFYYFIQIIIAIILAILNYFQSIFDNYSKMILGKVAFAGLFKQPWYFYIFILVTFGLSILLWVPRIYILWCIFSIWWIFRKYHEYTSNIYKLPNKGLDLLQLLLVWDSSYYICDSSIYVTNFISDYFMFLYEWSYSGGLYYNIYDFFYVFIYNEYYEIILYMYYFGIIHSEISPVVFDVESFFNTYPFLRFYFTVDLFYACVYHDNRPADFMALPLDVTDCSFWGLLSFVFWWRNLWFGVC